MKTIKSLLTLEEIEDLASRSNLRYGEKIVKDGDVKIIEQNTFNVVAHVQHAQGQKRTVKLESTPKGFRWKCTCSNRKDLFCQHVVATALYANENLQF
jgi:uncharacterized Zn finger protein